MRRAATPVKDYAGRDGRSPVRRGLSLAVGGVKPPQARRIDRRARRGRGLVGILPAVMFVKDHLISPQRQPVGVDAESGAVREDRRFVEPVLALAVASGLFFWAGA